MSHKVMTDLDMGHNQVKNVVLEVAEGFDKKKEGSIIFDSNLKKVCIYNGYGVRSLMDEDPHIDLSFRDVSMSPQEYQNTANCYRIITAGMYKLPLVYGNAIKNGADNRDAYTQIQQSGTAPFYNHLDNVISSPYIEDHEGCIAQSAELIWADAQNMITNVRILSNPNTICRYLGFSVYQVPSSGGNAVIGIKDRNGDVIWSWHIWVYPFDLTPVEIYNNTQNGYYIMPVNLGTINVEGKYKRSLYYQWGRKDPFPASASYTGNTEGTIYGGILVNSVVDANTTVGVNHKNPLTFYGFDSSYGKAYAPNINEYEYNYWDASCYQTGANEVDTIKTVFDPCPVDYKIPNARVFTGFTTTGNNSINRSEFNTQGPFDYGWFFKMFPTATSGIYFQALGRRYNNGSFNLVGSYGAYWTSGFYSQKEAHCLDFSSSSISVLNRYYLTSGCSVRPIRDKRSPMAGGGAV